MPVERGGFRITVPMSWWEFDVHPATREESIRRLVAQRVRENPALGEHRTVLAKFLVRAAKEAYESGAVYVGCMAEYVSQLPITATVTVSLVGARTSDGQLMPTDSAAIVAGLRERPARRRGDPWRKVTSVTIPEVGSAARTYGIEDVEPPGGGRGIRTVLTQTFVPVPGNGGKVVLIAGSSGVVDLADSFFDIFDAVTSTFRFVSAEFDGGGDAVGDADGAG